MGEKNVSIEFEGLVEQDGRISIPHDLLRGLPIAESSKVHVRVTGIQLNRALQKMQVTDEEIERIATLQLESRDQVVRFLLSEGALKTHGRFLRTSRGRRKGPGR